MFDATALCPSPEGVPACPAQAPAPIVRLELDALLPGYQLRLGGVDTDHVNVIALSEGNWPPVLVRRADNAIIDGHYRYRAARQLGHSHIDCVYFDGGEDAAFVEALWRNRNHGLPLSLRERERAAGHLLGLHPDWSDRRIAETCSLAPGTVGRLRSRMPRPSEDDDRGMVRMGRDGKRRPADPQASRARILRVLEAQPDRSLRAIARITGTSPATVRSVRDQPNLIRKCIGDAVEPSDVLGARSGANQNDLLVAQDQLAAPLTLRWVSDSALGATPEGKGFAGWLEQTNIGEESQDYVEGIPLSRVYEIADEARRRADAWLTFAAKLEGRARRPRGHGGAGAGGQPAQIPDTTPHIVPTQPPLAGTDRPYTRCVWPSQL
jgi:ParB-like chromosome segregation protein Spo0J